MSREFKSFGTILRELRELQEAPAVPAAISPLIAEVQAPQPSDPCRRERLVAARLAERVEVAVRALLREIAAEVLGRELLLAPVELDAIVARLRERYLAHELAVETTPDGDVLFTGAGGTIDASLGRRLEAALESSR